MSNSYTGFVKLILINKPNNLCCFPGFLIKINENSRSNLFVKIYPQDYLNQNESNTKGTKDLNQRLTYFIFYILFLNYHILAN